MSGKPVSVVIKTSTKPDKKQMAVFSLDNGRTKVVHFGQKNAPDYTKTRDKAQRSRYLSRHKARENWNAPMTAGALSRWILWGDSTSIRTNISKYKNKFNLK
tara:strand:+ start:656 stop:961 length:306 start_codon:yes stop_codon:yes gene_type:complete